MKVGISLTQEWNHFHSILVILSPSLPPSLPPSLLQFSISFYLVCNSSYQCPSGQYLNATNCSCNALHTCMTEDQPCQNGGTCEVMDGSGEHGDYFCTCPQNFTGVNCESEWPLYTVTAYNKHELMNLNYLNL